MHFHLLCCIPILLTAASKKTAVNSVTPPPVLSNLSPAAPDPSTASQNCTSMEIALGPVSHEGPGTFPCGSNGNNMTFSSTPLVDKATGNLQPPIVAPTAVLVEASPNLNGTMHSSTNSFNLQLTTPSGAPTNINANIHSSTDLNPNSFGSNFKLSGFQDSSIGDFNAMHEGTHLGMGLTSLEPGGYQFGAHNYQLEFSARGLPYGQFYANGQSADVQGSHSQMNWGLNSFDGV